MRKTGETFELSATDLVGYLNCHHLISLDRAVAEGRLEKPKDWDPLLEILWERGSIHEQAYVDHLTRSGLEVVKIDGIGVTDEVVSETLTAMKNGVSVIAQGALSAEGWVGRADILRRVELPSALGDWSYEPIDTKLARETKAGTILQLCLYSDLLGQAQGLVPHYMHVVVPWSDFEPEAYRFADYAAYNRQVKHGLRQFLTNHKAEETYPDPKDHCQVCRWQTACDNRRRIDDHLCLVAGISKLQINEVKGHGLAKTGGLAAMPLPLLWKPDRGSADSYERVREQARIQIEARQTGQRRFELLPVEIGFGLTRLPEPSQSDIFLDLEGDPFVGEHGLEYLFGYIFKDENDEAIYVGDWAFSRAELMPRPSTAVTHHTSRG